MGKEREKGKGERENESQRGQLLVGELRTGAAIRVLLSARTIARRRSMPGVCLAEATAYGTDPVPT